MMSDVVMILGGWPVTWRDLAAGGAAIALLLLALLVWTTARASRERSLEAAMAAERQRELDDKVAELNRQNAEVTARLQTMAEIFGGRQAELSRVMADRMDAVRTTLGQGLVQQGERASEALQRLHERLAVIDAAQQNLAQLTAEVLVLKDILANKQARGAYGQGRMEAILRDGLPPNAFSFQSTLSNRNRPDALVHLPGDPRPLVIDAKFPLEGFALLDHVLREGGDVAGAERQVRADLAAHIKAVADRYLIPGETQDMALLFLPAESIYATIAERFEDVLARAHRARVLLVSPSLMMLAVQLIQAIVRDHRMREEAHHLQREVGLLLEDVRRLGERTQKLETHFRQAQTDVGDIATSAERITRRGGRIGAMEFEDRTALPAPRAAE